MPNMEPVTIRRAINQKALRLAAIECTRIREVMTAAVQAARKAGATEQELVELVNGWEPPGDLGSLGGAGDTGHSRPVAALVSSH